jgi:hypothetical protein
MKPEDRVLQMIGYLAKVPHGTAYIPYQTLKKFFRCKAEDVSEKTILFAQNNGLSAEKLDENTWKFERRPDSVR